MSLKRPAAFTLIVGVLLIGSRIPGPSAPEIPRLAIDSLRAASQLTSRGERASEGLSALPELLRYENPAYADPDDRFSKDPAVIEHDGKYYVYYFGFTPDGHQAVKVASSVDLAHWRYDGVALEARHDGAWDADLIWAPDVVFRHGLFYMYYSGGRRGPDSDIDWNTMRIGLAISREPTGQFVRYASTPILTPPLGNGVIDPDFFADDDGKDYLYYVVQSQSPDHWEGIRVQRIDDMVHLHDDAKVIDPTADWEANIVEAPTVFKENGYYYLLYSGGGSDYGQRVGYAYSRFPAAAGGRDAGNKWTKYPTDSAPEFLLNHSDGWSDVAVGSTSLILGPDHHAYVVYQGKNSLDGKFRLGMVRLLFDNRRAAARLTW